MDKPKIPIKLKPQELETKWQKKWKEVELYRTDILHAKKPYYNLMMFPYPSAEGLHIGNMYAFTGVDIHGRYMRLRGYDVFEPIGLDGFGIHSENYAIKVGRTPREHAHISQQNFYRQLHAIGNMFDWSRTLETYDPDYYRWTQWIFVTMFKHGLAYRDKAEVNWCPSCKTVLADEQVIDGKCERCSTAVIKKELEQWFFRITAYAERLLQNTYKPHFKWSEKVKIGQRNWIGKKEGINISYPIVKLSNDPIIQLSNNPVNTNKKQLEISVFTTRPDTNFGATFVVIAPEHPIINIITTPENCKQVNEYIKKSQSKSKEDRLAEGRQKTGVFTGTYAINQLNGYKMPIWVSDFVLMEVGTGVVVGVPGHDKRDFEFAQTFSIPIKRVVVGKDQDRSEITQIEQVQEEMGIMVNSGFLDGMDIHTATEKIMDYFEKKGWGKRITTYHLRDWLISRQRYWGAPIPMIYCETCASKNISWFTTVDGETMLINPNAQIPNFKQIKNTNNQNIGNWKLEIGNSMRSMAGWFPVPEEQLPVLLPDVKDWKPTGTGKGPLAGHPEFYKTTCPHCGSNAELETDVCDTFLDSSWYYLRYPFAGQNDYNSPQPSLTKRGSSVAKVPPLFKRGLGGVTESLPWNKEILARWLPVDSYIGGAEHTVLHLLYTRFMWMALKDWGYIKLRNQKRKTDSGVSRLSRDPQNDVILANEGMYQTVRPEVRPESELLWDSDEPFKRFFAHGLIIKDGAKMSKSKGNVVIPDEYIKLYGADTLRTYLMFLGPFDRGGDFRDSGIAGMYRWLSRVWRLVNPSVKRQGGREKDKPPVVKDVKLELNRVLAKTIKAVTNDMENLRYNTAIARLMEFVNWWVDHPDAVDSASVTKFLIILAPFAPHMTEELFQKFKVQSSKFKVSNLSFTSIHQQKWPTFDEKLLIEDLVTIVVQVNGKLRDLIEISAADAKIKEKVEKITQNSQKTQIWLTGKKIKQVFFVPQKLINFVV